MEFRALHAQLGAEVLGFDMRQVSDAEYREVLDAFERYSVLVFREQDLTVEQHVDFSARFGPLEDALTRLGDDDAGRRVSNISNVDSQGAIRDSAERAMLARKANELWHTDSSFKAVPALASILRAIKVPPAGGETEFVSTRAGYADLDDAMKQRVEGIVCMHSYAHSRAQVAPGLLPRALVSQLPPVRRRLVYEHPDSGARSLYLASHICEVLDMSKAEGAALIESLRAHCTGPERVYSHAWRPGDLVMWDNRNTMHRGRGYDSARYPRIMYRTTISDTSAALDA